MIKMKKEINNLVLREHLTGNQSFYCRSKRFTTLSSYFLKLVDSEVIHNNYCLGWSLLTLTMRHEADSDNNSWASSTADQCQSNNIVFIVRAAAPGGEQSRLMTCQHCLGSFIKQTTMFNVEIVLCWTCWNIFSSLSSGEGGSSSRKSSDSGHDSSGHSPGPSQCSCSSQDNLNNSSDIRWLYLQPSHLLNMLSVQIIIDVQWVQYNTVSAVIMKTPVVTR